MSSTSKRHALFVACSEAVVATDAWLSELFLAFAYGVYPMAVHEDAAAETLVFRRTGGGTVEKDKVTRLQKAAQDLAAQPEIEAYNKKNNTPLFINAVTISVSWPMDVAVPVDTHVRLIGCLLRWTRMERFDGVDGPWGKLYRQLPPMTSVPPVQSRTIRAAAILEFAGTQAQDQGLSDERCLRRVQQVMEALNNGKLRVDSGPDGSILSINIIAPPGGEED